jgi:hypothetical protein
MMGTEMVLEKAVLLHIQPPDWLLAEEFYCVLYNKIQKLKVSKQIDAVKYCVVTSDTNMEKE